ncbi:esterase E4-like [Galleria mellonella]|uniref:Carboxylic ester hydrolase n=1 Tax=Galleria mellonella TaxID=7137 RepID=A0A6J1WHD2_GALME|nr:esterase E4-like [Galleria mellonella]
MYRIVIVCIITIVFIDCADGLINGKWLGNDAEYKDVITSFGTVRGRVATDGDYFAFLGIPYAEPPVGKRRFKAPFPPSPWDGVYEANRTVMCPQNGVGQEDCLILNIFTPTKIINELVPVLVYIHGGSFLIGSGPTKGMDYLIKENIIVVTINYRLGALGFLCLGIDEAPGNAGMKDQVAALEWIKRNIANFGGDPNEVTIYGMSAGAASVELLVLSKMSRGLFKRAIVESASARPVWVVDGNPIKTAMDVASLLEFPKKTKNVFKLVEHYQQIPSNKLSEINYAYYNNLIDGTFGFVPCIERNFNEKQPFLVDAPHEILVKEKFKKVPIMFMFATMEGLFLRSREYYENNYRERMDGNFIDFMPADLNFDTIEIKNEISENVKSFYFGNKTISNETIVEYLNYFGDYLVLDGILNSAEIHARNNNPVYLMEFAYKGNMGSNEEFYKNINVAGHGDIVKHAILNQPLQNEVNEKDKLTVQRVSKLIANFVKLGNPTPTRTSLLPIIWPLVQPNNVSCLYLNHDFEVIEEPYWDRKVFWDQLYTKFRRPLRPVNPGLL